MHLTSILGKTGLIHLHFGATSLVRLMMSQVDSEAEILGDALQVQKAEVRRDVPRFMLRRLRGDEIESSPLIEQQGEGDNCLRFLGKIPAA